MHWLLDPSAWLGFIVLTVIVVALGVSSLILITALSVPLPAERRQRARGFGLIWFAVLSCALAALIDWVLYGEAATAEFRWMGPASLSPSDLLLFLGGLYLIKQATIDLLDRGQGKLIASGDGKVYKTGWHVFLQVVVISSLLSFEAAALAAGVSTKLGVWILAFLSATFVLWFMFDRLAQFVSSNPGIVTLTAGFSLMVGLVLLSRAMGVAIAKPYLYIAIIFSGAIAVLWQLTQRKLSQPNLSARERAVAAVLALFGQQRADELNSHHNDGSEAEHAPVLGVEQRNMMSGVLALSERSVHSIMTPRTEVSWIDIDDGPERIREQIEQAPHSFFPVCRGSFDEIIGIGRAKRMIADLLTHGRVQESRLREPIIVHDTIGMMRLIETLKNSRGQLVLVADEFGAIEGLVTPIDVFEAIAGEFPDEDEAPDIVPDGENRWRVDGAADLHILEQVLEIEGLVNEDEEYTTLAGYLLNYFGRLPSVGEGCTYQTDRVTISFKVVRLERRRIAMVHVERHEPASNEQTGEVH